MELRPVQAALLAGRCASRRATAAPLPLSYSLTPSSYRCFSQTRPSLSEAEATAPRTPSMQEWQQQQQQRQQQPQPRASNTNPNSSSTLASLLRPNNSNPSSSPPTTTADPSDESRRNPWAVPTSTGLRRAQANRAAAEGSTTKPGILDTLADLNLLGPSSDDFRATRPTTESAADVKFRLRPSVGRTVNLDRTVDLARGLGLLNTRVRVNKINQDLSKQRFHERPGLKRKRLRSERWRARFKDGFKATCSRVQELARQGW